MKSDKLFTEYCYKMCKRYKSYYAQGKKIAFKKGRYSKWIKANRTKF